MQLEDGFISDEILTKEKEKQYGSSLGSLWSGKRFCSFCWNVEISVKLYTHTVYFKEIHSETVRCGSHSTLKTSHLWSTTACFNPHRLSENSKWGSKPFHHCCLNHMPPHSTFSSSFCSWSAPKTNSETLNCPGVCMHYMQGLSLRCVIHVFAVTDIWVAAKHVLFAVICCSTNTKTRVYSKFSIVKRVQAQFIICSVCMPGQGWWIIMTTTVQMMVLKISEGQQNLSRVFSPISTPIKSGYFIVTHINWAECVSTEDRHSN